MEPASFFKLLLYSLDNDFGKTTSFPSIPMKILFKPSVLLDDALFWYSTRDFHCQFTQFHTR